jgi:hypothetical protein
LKKEIIERIYKMSSNSYLNKLTPEKIAQEKERKRYEYMMNEYHELKEKREEKYRQAVNRSKTSNKIREEGDEEGEGENDEDDDLENIIEAPVELKQEVIYSLNHHTNHFDALLSLFKNLIL